MIFGDDSGSCMFWEFIDFGIVEYVGMGVYEYVGVGLIMSVICCEFECLDEFMVKFYKM